MGAMHIQATMQDKESQRDGEVASSGRLRVGAVSYLNTLPLIEGLRKLRDVELTLAVPSRLSTMLADGELDIALAPIIDAPRANEPLTLLPAGMIGSDGPTLTVKLSSVCPIEQIRMVHADTDSRTSVALTQIVLKELYNVSAEFVSFDWRQRLATKADGESPGEWPDALLMIGDKVVTAAAPDESHPHQLDLGEAWKRLTGLPFVYAMWMMRRELEDDPRLVGVAAALDRQRRRNVTKLDWIATSNARELGWPLELARPYLGAMLQYEVGAIERDAVELFYAKASHHGLIPKCSVRWAQW